MSFLLYAVIMFKRRTSGKIRNEQIIQDISRKGYAIGSSLAINNPRQETKTSRKESSQGDKDGSWDNVTSQGQMTTLTRSEEYKFPVENQFIQALRLHRKRGGSE